jgi:hypothetical protein
MWGTPIFRSQYVCTPPKHAMYFFRSSEDRSGREQEGRPNSPQLYHKGFTAIQAGRKRLTRPAKGWRSFQDTGGGVGQLYCLHFVTASSQGGAQRFRRQSRHNTHYGWLAVIFLGGWGLELASHRQFRNGAL